jgi:hypothetical protein
MSTMSCEGAGWLAHLSGECDVQESVVVVVRLELVLGLGLSLGGLARSSDSGHALLLCFALGGECVCALLCLLDEVDVGVGDGLCRRRVERLGVDLGPDVLESAADTGVGAAFASSGLDELACGWDGACGEIRRGREGESVSALSSSHRNRAARTTFNSAVSPPAACSTLDSPFQNTCPQALAPTVTLAPDLCLAELEVGLCDLVERVFGPLRRADDACCAVVGEHSEELGEVGREAAHCGGGGVAMLFGSTMTLAMTCAAA